MFLSEGANHKALIGLSVQMTSANSIVCIVSKPHASMLRICQKKCRSSMVVTMATAQAKIGQQDSKEHFGTCRSFLHGGRIKLLI